MTQRFRADRFKGHKIMISGVQGTGKTNMARYLITRISNHAVALRNVTHYDAMPDKLMTLIDRDRAEDDGEQLERIAKTLVTQYEAWLDDNGDKPKIDTLVVDEAEMFFDHVASLKPYVKELMMKHRHYGITIIMITRRPQDVASYVNESSKFKIIYYIDGVNVKKYISSLHEDMDEYLDSLDLDSYEYILKEMGKPPKVSEKVPLTYEVTENS